ncbi:hypothetical protein ACLI1R_000697 [Corynebacterium sp. LaCa97]|uniref:phage upper tail fiber protein n=1 Tax=Corynebacterium sp. LaCa97 TaxID=3391431 RepID=UPI00205A758E|nr:MAG TPA: tail fiber protein [Caudoviricetes sp.]
MPTVSGNLVFVSSRAAQVSEVWLHAREVRTHTAGVVTTGNDRFPVEDGEVTFTALPGPAVLALISQGRAVDTIPIVVGESEAQSLRNVVRAAQVVDEAASREIERLSAEMMEALDSAREEASAAQGYASTAQEQASAASSSAEDAASSAEEARGHASTAEGHATASQQSAEESGRAADRAEGARSEARTAWDGAKEARDAAEGHASTAEGHANTASSSASDAQGAAGRADTSAQQVREIAESTRWDGDQVTVNGKQSPHLTGPKGETGPQGPPGTVDGIDFEQYAKVEQLSEMANKQYVDSAVDGKQDKSKVLDSLSRSLEGTTSTIGGFGRFALPRRVVVTGNDGWVTVEGDPEEANHVVNKNYVDEQVSNVTVDTSGLATKQEVSAVRDRVGALESGGSFWTGSKAEYDRIGRKDSNTLYIVR